VRDAADALHLRRPPRAAGSHGRRTDGRRGGRAFTGRGAAAIPARRGSGGAPRAGGAQDDRGERPAAVTEPSDTLPADVVANGAVGGLLLGWRSAAGSA